jgi:outer membrane protein assembly factor BamB
LLWQIVAAKVKIVTIVRMRVKKLLIVMMLVIGVNPVFAWKDTALLWEYKLPPIDPGTITTIQHIWSVNGFTVCYNDHSNECASPAYSIYCVDNNTGKQVWEPITTKSSGYRIVHTTIVCDSKKMYFVSALGKIISVVCFDVAKRCQVWKSDVSVPTYNQACSITLGGKTDKYYWYYNGTSKKVRVHYLDTGNLALEQDSRVVAHAVVGDRVYLEDEFGKVVKCYDIPTNKMLWKMERPKGTCIFTLECSGKAFVSTKNEQKSIQSHVICLDAATGLNAWTLDIEGLARAFWANDEKVCISIQSDLTPSRARLVKMKDGKQIWETQFETSNFELQCLGNSLIGIFAYACKPSQMHIFSMETGKRIWVTTSSHMLPPFVFEGKIYYIDGVPPSLRYLKRIDPDGKGFIWIICGRINDVFVTGQKIILAQDEKITCYGDANP